MTKLQVSWARTRISGWLFAGLLTLSGCGGGGGGGGSSDGGSDGSGTPATPTLPKVAAQLKATYQADTGRTTVQWTDALPDELQYVLQRSSGTEWLTVQQVDAQNGLGQPVQTEASLAPGSMVRVIATTPQGTLVLSTADQKDSLIVAANAGTLALDAGSASPLAGVVPVSISGLSTAVAVQYLVDLHLQTRVSSGAGYAWSWATPGVTDGTHLLQAIIETTPSSFVELRKQVTVDNPNVSAGLVVQAQLTGTTLVVSANSSGGSISQVALSLDGLAQGTLTQANTCSYSSCGVPNAYGFTVPNSTLGHGSHTASVVVTDSNGETRTVAQSFFVNSAPVIHLVAPAAGTILAADALVVRGSTEDDAPGTTVQVKVGDVTLPHDGSASFDLGYALTGLPDGAYTVRIQATDAQGATTQLQRSFIRQTGSTFAYTALQSLGTGNLLASHGDDLLVQQGSSADSPIQWLRPQGNVTLQNAAVTYANNWQLSSAGVSTYGVGNGAGTGYETYFWGTDGLRRSLSSEVSSGVGLDEHVTASGDWQLWSTRTPGVAYFLVNTSTGQSYRIAPPSETRYQGNWQFTLVPGSAGVKVYYWAALQAGGTGTQTAFAIYRYDSGTGQSTRLTPAGTGWRDVYVQTDGQRIAWQRNPSSASIDPPYSLMVANLASDTQATELSATMQSFMMGDGLLAWREGSGTNSTLKVNDGQATTVLSQTAGSSLVGVGGGAVVYGSSNKLWLWTPAAGIRSLLAAPAGVQISSGGLYLIVGEDRSVVRVTGW